MIYLNNRWIVISCDDPSFDILKINLEFNESTTRRIYKKVNGKTRVTTRNFNNLTRLYKISSKGNMLINIGMFNLLNSNGYFHNSKIEDLSVRSPFYYIPDIVSTNIKNYSNILDGIELRIDQLIALRKMISIKRGIVQLPTGVGKTEIMCAFIQIFKTVFGKYPTVLIIENNTNLVDGTINRLRKYNIPCDFYSKTRKIDKESVIVCHPASVCNDLKKNKDLLNEINMILCDECHHVTSNQNRTIIENASNVDYCIGLSASVIDKDHVMSKKINEYSVNELQAIGLLGSLMINRVSGDSIEMGNLAIPVLLRFHNDASYESFNEEVNKGNWHAVQKVRLQSDKRNEIIVRCSEFFINKGRKVLILVNTIEWSRKLLKMFNEFDMNDSVRASYGGGAFEKISDSGDLCEDDNCLNRFDNGEFGILIGTSHIYEGTDIKNLDVIILAYGGKKDRLQIQGTGRALRKTKTGKYAYIVDFTDDGDRMLSRQSNQRFERYKNEMKIPESRIFNDITIGRLSDIFDELEN